VARLSVAGRAILSPIVRALERIAFDDDPLRVLLIETGYQPFIFLFSMLSAKGPNGQLTGIRAYARVYLLPCIHCHIVQPTTLPFCRLRSSVVLLPSSVTLFVSSLRRRIAKLHTFDHPEQSVPVTEFIYQLEVRRTELAHG